jgi:CRISPR type I-D-associated protein Csc2
LGTRYAVRPATLFPSIITLKSVTIEELVLTIKTLLAAKSYGAETRIGGDVRNTITGIAAGWEEIMTSLELTLELSADNELVPEQVSRILESYKSLAGNPQKVRVFGPEEVEAIVTEAANKEIDLDLLKSLYSQVDEYRNNQLKG